MRFPILLAAFLTVSSASAQTLDVRSYGTSGHPTEAYATSDGQYVLVTVDRGKDSSGIDIFHADGDKLKRIAFQPLGTEGAQGILLIPHTHILAVGLSNAGVAFLPLDDAIMGKAKPQVLSQGENSGSGYLAVTPEGTFLFVANEYGEHGNIGVIALHPGSDGQVHPQMVARIPTPNTTPGITISPDGSRVYTQGEVVRPEAADRLPGHGIPQLQRSGCLQGRPDRPMPNGVLYAIDVAKATALAAGATPEEAHHAVIAASDSGCSPVRESMSPDGTLYVTARGDNAVLAFDTRKLETDRQHAFLRSIPSGGEAPVGIRVFAGGKAMLVANSNRFAGGSGNAAVFNLSDPANPVLRQTIKTGSFPRNITTSADGATLYLTVFLGDELLVLRPKP